MSDIFADVRRKERIQRLYGLLNGFLKGKDEFLYLAEEFIDVSVVLSHPLDEVIKFLDEIADLPAEGQCHSGRTWTPTHIIAAEVETRGPGEDQREWLPGQRFRIPSQ